MTGMAPLRHPITFPNRLGLSIAVIGASRARVHRCSKTISAWLRKELSRATPF